MRDSHAVQKMYERIDSLKATNVFSTKGANNGYWQIELGKDVVDKTAIATHNELYRYSYMLYK